MDIAILVISIITLTVSLILCFIAVKMNNRSKVDYSDVITDALEKRISVMEQNLTTVENDEQERTRKHNEEMNGAMRELNKQGLETINSSLSTTLKEDRENNKAILEGTIKQIDGLRELNKKEFEVMNTALNAVMKEDRENNKAMLEGNNKLISTSFDTVNKTIETRLNKLTETQERSFNLLREENNKQIDKIRETVSEKLDKTLNEQFDKSFKGVLTQMTELQKTMGELKGISTQVGSLEKTLNGIKTRGISGEVQLKQIIADVLPPQHYDIEVPTKPDSSDHVEIAIKLPDREGKSFYYLPIDSKCHLDRYEALLNAYDGGDPVAVRKAKKEFADAIRSDAKDIAEKYISVPHTTPYAILFVPFEGMYSEIVNLDLLDDLNPLHITVAGPYTLMAILSTVTNYFQALAIEKKSHEIEATLGKVKKEFSAYEDLLGRARKNLDIASGQLDELSGRRTRAVNKALKNITELDEGLLPAETEDDDIE